MINITIYDIAREAGVSPATVSRVLTNKTCVSEKKRQIVDKIIKKHNYRPNAAARSLSGGTRVIGLMAADIRNPYYAAITIECEKAANEQGYTVLLCNMLNDQTLEDDHLEKFHAQRVEAIIQLGRRTDDLVSDSAYVEHVGRISRRIPFITTGKLDGVDCFSVSFNHAQSMKIVMDYLIFLGHREIALVGGSKSVQPTYIKLNQYIQSLETNKLRFRKEFFQEGDYADATGYSSMERLLKAKIPPTAVIAINDVCAVGAITAAQDHGLSVPGDVSVIGFDNIFLATLVRPSLTTVDCNYPLFGKTLVDTAIQAARGKKPSRQILIEPRLIIRESSGPPVKLLQGKIRQQKL
jgi:DNA-binding LacI/PurR family transcriptional regulator